jgi:hypothetical protein
MQNISCPAEQLSHAQEIGHSLLRHQRNRQPFTVSKIDTGGHPLAIKLGSFFFFFANSQCLNNIQFIPSGIFLLVTERRENHAK